MQLVVQSGAEPGKTYDLNPDGKLSIGRQSANDIVVSDEQVSRRHAEIQAVANGVLVTDLGSSNGTFVNGTRVSSPQTIRSGDTLQVGTTVLRLVDSESMASTLPAGYDQPAPAATSYSSAASQAPAQPVGYGSYPQYQQPDQSQTPGSYNQAASFGQAQGQASYSPAPVGSNAYQPNAYNAANPGYATPATPPSTRKGLPPTLLLAIIAIIVLIIVIAVVLLLVVK